MKSKRVDKHKKQKQAKSTKNTIKIEKASLSIIL